MITYRYSEIEIDNNNYVLIELLDYEKNRDKDIFDTIVYNNESFRGKALLMHDKKNYPSNSTFTSGVSSLEEYLKDMRNANVLKWCGPFNL
ncbi:MAG: hypothetical protein EOO61_09250 [Hymenobacter sp.]|nr:MAG: hypothetical protein EOO61_09250 [Hymenobacter sp.]